MTALAPVAIFAFNRPDHLGRLIASLRSNPEAPATEIFVFCDGPRSAADHAAVEAVRSQVAGLEGFARVTRTYRNSNLGLARSIVAGVNEVLFGYDSVIVLEDDLVLSRHFLRFMNEGLTCYALDDRVASIHGYCYPTRAPLPDTFFLRGADCWGWATWRRAWGHFRPDGAALLKELSDQGLTRQFDLGGTAAFTRMLKEQVQGKNNSWAIRWHASCFLADRLTLYPGRSLVENIGNDDSGTHSIRTEVYSKEVAQEPVRVERIPIAPSEQAREAFARFFRSRRWNFGDQWNRVRQRIRRSLR